MGTQTCGDMAGLDRKMRRQSRPGPRARDGEVDQLI